MEEAKRNGAAPTEKKDNNKKKADEPSKLMTFYTNIKAEFKKIIWPKKEDLAKQTLIVVVVCLIIGAAIFGMDSLFGYAEMLVANFI